MQKHMKLRGGGGNFRLLASLCLAALAAGFAFSSPPGGGGGPWTITYNWDGWVTNDVQSQHFTFTMPTFGAASSPTGPSAHALEVSATVTVTVKYTGPMPVPSTPYYLKTVSATSATAQGAVASVGAQDSFGRATQATFQGGQTITMNGEGLQAITLDKNNAMTITLTASASANATGNPYSTAVQAGFACSVTQRGLDITPLAPIPTYYRPPGGGIPQPNAVDPNTGQFWMDIGATVYTGDFCSLNWGTVDLAARTDGAGWWLPVDSMAWTGLPSGASVQSVSTNLALGSTEVKWGYATTFNSYSDLLSAMESWYKSGYLGWPVILTVTDYYGTESKGTMVNYHGPLEATGDEWADPYSGPLDQCPTSVVGDAYAPNIIAILPNPNEDSSLTGDIEVSQTFETTYGWSTALNAQLSAGIKDVLNLVFGINYTFDSSKKWGIGLTIKTNYTVPPGEQAVAIVYHDGTATFPLASNWNAQGYSGDTELYDTTQTAEAFTIIYQPINGGGGGN